MNDERVAVADLRARVLAEVRKTPAPTRTEHRRRVLGLAAAGAVLTTLMFVAMGGFAPGARPLELIAFTAGGALVAALVLQRLSGGPGGGSDSMLGRPRVVLLTACVVAAPVLALLALGATLIWPAPAGEAIATKSHLGCAVMSIVQGALPLVVLLLPRRGSDPLHPALSGAALGMTAGAWTAMMAYLRCPHAGAGHCLLAHVAPTLVLTVVGAALGAVMLRVRE